MPTANCADVASLSSHSRPPLQVRDLRLNHQGSPRPVGGADAALRDLESSLPSLRPQGLQWSQDLVEDNGGTILAVAGPDYCILAADTRLSSSYQIRTRNVTRVLQVRAALHPLWAPVHPWEQLWPILPLHDLTGLGKDVHGHGRQLGGCPGTTQGGRDVKSVSVGPDGRGFKGLIGSGGFAGEALRLALLCLF